MHLRIVFEDHKYQIERKGLFGWLKLHHRRFYGNGSGNYKDLGPLKYETIDEAIDWANCYIEQQIEGDKNSKVIIGHIKI